MKRTYLEPLNNIESKKYSTANGINIIWSSDNQISLFFILHLEPKLRKLVDQYVLKAKFITLNLL